METKQRPSVLITGVSTGIGFDATRYLIARGYDVFGSVRKRADADRLEQAFPAHFTPLLFDVSDAAAIERAVGEVRQRLGNRGLVYVQPMTFDNVINGNGYGLLYHFEIGGGVIFGR